MQFLTQIFGKLPAKNGGRKIKILKTPHTPQPVFILIFTAVLVSWNCTTVLSQNNLLQYNDYKESLKTYYNKKWTAERTEFVALNKKSILYYFPSLGIAFGLPSVSWNPVQILNYKREKKIVEQKLKSIDLRNNLEYNEALLDLKIMYYKIQTNDAKIKNQEDYIKLELQKHKAIEEGVHAREVDPISFLEVKKSLLKQKQDLNIMRFELNTQILELERFAHYKLTNENLTFDANYGCILEER